VWNEYRIIVMGMTMQWCYPLRKLRIYSLLIYLLALSGLFSINFTCFFRISKIKDGL